MHNLDRDAGPLEGAAAGSWSLGIVEKSQGEGRCWPWRDGLRGGEGGDCGGKCLWRKARQPWKQGNTAEWYVVGAATTTASPQTWKHQQLNTREADPPNTWLTELQSRTPSRCPFSDRHADLQRRTPGKGALSVWMGGATKKDWPKRPSDCQLQRLEKRLWEGHTSCSGGSSCPCTLVMPGSPQAKQLHLLHGQLSLGQSCHRQESCVYVLRVTSVLSDSLWPCRLWPSRLLCQGGQFSRQEHWSVLANAGCHTLLEHYISCSPSCQPPWVPGAARAPATQAAAPPPHLTGADPSPPGHPREQTPLDDPRAEVEIKPQLKPQGRCG